MLLEGLPPGKQSGRQHPRSGTKGTTPAIVDFPTPPFAEETAITFFTSLILRFSGSPRRRGKGGGVPERGSPYEGRSAIGLKVETSETNQRIIMLEGS